MSNKSWLFNYDFEFSFLPKNEVPSNTSPFFRFLNQSGLILLPIINSSDTLLNYELPGEEALLSLYKKRVRAPSMQIFKSYKAQNDLALWGGIFPKKKAGTLNPLAWINNKILFYSEILPKTRTFYNLKYFILDNISVIEKLQNFFDTERQIILKHPWGVFSRHQIPVLKKNEINNNLLNKIKPWLENGGELLVQPFYEIQREISFHYQFEKSHISTVGQTEIIKNQSGIAIGYKPLKLNKTKSWELINQIAEEISQLGYKGPLGIDVIETKKGKLIPLEINARWTMGRMALEWRRFLGLAETSECQLNSSRIKRPNSKGKILISSFESKGRSYEMSFTY